MSRKWTLWTLRFFIVSFERRYDEHLLGFFFTSFWSLNLSSSFFPSKLDCKSLGVMISLALFFQFLLRKMVGWVAFVDCKTVGFFFLKISKEIRVKCGVRVLRARASHAPILASPPSLAVCFQPRSRRFVWLLARSWIRKNTDCFAVYRFRGFSSL